MPNHVTHRLVVNGPVDDVAAFKQLMIVKEDANLPPWSGAESIGDQDWVDTLDFNRLVPQPQIIEHVIHPLRRGPNGRVLVHDDPSSIRQTEGGREATEAEQTEIDTALQTLGGDPIVTFVADTMPLWYSWRLANWGTKWNAYGFREAINQATYGMRFDTAWSTPVPIIDKLVELFPTLSFDISWVDEGWIHAGEGVLKAHTSTSAMDQIFRAPSDEICEKIYGTPQSSESTSLFTPPDRMDTAVDQLRHLENFECLDVAAASNPKGYYPLTAVYYSDDSDYTDDELHDMHRDRERIRRLAGIV